MTIVVFYIFMLSVAHSTETIDTCGRAGDVSASFQNIVPLGELVNVKRKSPGSIGGSIAIQAKRYKLAERGITVYVYEDQADIFTHTAAVGERPEASIGADAQEKYSSQGLSFSRTPNGILEIRGLEAEDLLYRLEPPPAKKEKARSRKRKQPVAASSKAAEKTDNSTNNITKFVKLKSGEIIGFSEGGKAHLILGSQQMEISKKNILPNPKTGNSFELSLRKGGCVSIIKEENPMTEEDALYVDITPDGKELHPVDKSNIIFFNIAGDAYLVHFKGNKPVNIKLEQNVPVKTDTGKTVTFESLGMVVLEYETALKLKSVKNKELKKYGRQKVRIEKQVISVTASAE